MEAWGWERYPGAGVGVEQDVDDLRGEGLPDRQRELLQNVGCWFGKIKMNIN
jgi:hypothetical protein